VREWRERSESERERERCVCVCVFERDYPSHRQGVPGPHPRAGPPLPPQLDLRPPGPPSPPHFNPPPPLPSAPPPAPLISSPPLPSALSFLSILSKALSAPCPPRACRPPLIRFLLSHHPFRAFSYRSPPSLSLLPLSSPLSPPTLRSLSRHPSLPSPHTAVSSRANVSVEFPISFRDVCI
jgi:hypothetical protein